MKQKIDARFIRGLNPCSSGIENFEKHYPNFKGYLWQILSLENIPYSDKVWLASRLTKTITLQQWAVECAESVLENFETAMPNDSRVRDCIETTKKFLLGGATLEDLAAARSAAWSAAESAWSAAAESAAWSAESAAWPAARSAAAAESAAESAWSAARSAAESAARSAAESAAESAWSAEELNISILIALINNED